MAETTALTVATVGGWLAAPWHEDVVRRAFFDIVLIGLVAGPLGCWVVLYRQSYSAESLAHSMFPGLVLAALTGIPLLAGGALGLLVAALAIAVVGRVPRVGADTAVAIIVTTLFGLGALLALSPASPAGIQGLLFGDVLAVSDRDLIVAAAFAAFALLALLALHRPLLTVGFDRGAAATLGVRPAIAEAALLLLLAATILIAVQSLGNLLVFAIVVAPAATARLLAGRMPALMTLAALFAAVAGIGGLYASFYLGTAAGASIAAVAVVTYLLTMAIDSVARA